ncbi:c-type cytochrome [Luteimonas mephitis]|uniref:c-type cytochrome n=1 Tax=Luteimonas mephitis TaxID=83615 RepID=UPI000A04B2EE|nr:c-type cytochrome [Luteimonas mephitis]
MSRTDRNIAEGGESAGRIRSGRGARRAIYALGGGLVLFALGVLLFERAPRADRDNQQSQSAAAPTLGVAGQSPVRFVPPAEDTIPDGPSGESILRGRNIFMNTPTNAAAFVGNQLSCSNCHLDNGRRADSAPMWAAWLAYPKYRAKNDRINTMEDRINGCFSYSMNAQDSPSGGPPPAGHDVYKDLQAYMHWLATGAPTNSKVEGAGYLALEMPEQGYDPARGAQVYATNCAVCHGADGSGQRDLNGRLVFPPLWGADSYNWGAGMARIDTAAGFIKANMPYGQSNRLTDQEAWDVAAYIDVHERPRDPRQAGMTVAEAAEKFHKGDETYYGKTIDGALIGTGTPAPVHD